MISHHKLEDVTAGAFEVGDVESLGDLDCLRFDLGRFEADSGGHLREHPFLERSIDVGPVKVGLSLCSSLLVNLNEHFLVLSPLADARLVDGEDFGGLSIA